MITLNPSETRVSRHLFRSHPLRAFLPVVATMARLRRDRLTNRIGVNIGPRVDGSGINRGIKSEISFVCLVGSGESGLGVFLKLFVLEGFPFPPWPNLGLYLLYDDVGWVSLE